MSCGLPRVRRSAGRYAAVQGISPTPPRAHLKRTIDMRSNERVVGARGGGALLLQRTLDLRDPLRECPAGNQVGSVLKLSKGVVF